MAYSQLLAIPRINGSTKFSVHLPRSSNALLSSSVGSLTLMLSSFWSKLRGDILKEAPFKNPWGAFTTMSWLLTYSSSWSRKSALEPRPVDFSLVWFSLGTMDTLLFTCGVRKIIAEMRWECSQNYKNMMYSLVERGWDKSKKWLEMRRIESINCCTKY